VVVFRRREDHFSLIVIWVSRNCCEKRPEGSKITISKKLYRNLNRHLKKNRERFFPNGEISPNPVTPVVIYVCRKFVAHMTLHLKARIANTFIGRKKNHERLYF
jgi:hypothetical protein